MNSPARSNTSRLDDPPETTFFEVDRIKRSLERKGYHVSFGIAVQDKSDGAMDVRELVKTAENNMFSAKREFYHQPEHNKRER